ncbi:MAG: hypothetical protein WBX27_04130 [Specibacter sp.]
MQGRKSTKHAKTGIIAGFGAVFTISAMFLGLGGAAAAPAQSSAPVVSSNVAVANSTGTWIWPNSVVVSVSPTQASDTYMNNNVATARSTGTWIWPN